MKITYFHVTLTAIILMLASCSDDAAQLQTRSNNENLYEAYFESASSKTKVSLLDIALGKESVDDLQNYNLLFTEKDVEILYNLSPEELIELKDSIMRIHGISSEEEMERIVDESYEKFCTDMDDDELRKINSFGEQYLAMPAGFASFSKVYPNEMTGNLAEIEKYLQYAIAIDNFARPLYDRFVVSTRSPSECQKYLAIRLLITSVSFCSAWILPGGTIYAVYSAVYDVFDAALRYKLCLRTRTFE